MQRRHRPRRWCHHQRRRHRLTVLSPTQLHLSTPRHYTTGLTALTEADRQDAQEAATPSISCASRPTRLMRRKLADSASWPMPPAPPPQSPLNEPITHVLRGQERLMTKLAKLDLANTRTPPRHGPRPPPARTESHANDTDNLLLIIVR